MRVVCAACNEHYADMETGLPQGVMLARSDELAVEHAPRCTASREEHAAGLEWIEAMKSAFDSGSS